MWAADDLRMPGRKALGEWKALSTLKLISEA